MRAEPWTTAAHVRVFTGCSILSEVLCVQSRAFSSVFRQQSCHTIHRCAPACLSMLSHESPTTVCTRHVVLSVQPRGHPCVQPDMFGAVTASTARKPNRTSKAWPASRRSHQRTRGAGGTQGLYTQVVPQLRVLICCHRGPEATSAQRTVSTPRNSLSLIFNSAPGSWLGLPGSLDSHAALGIRSLQSQGIKFRKMFYGRASRGRLRRHGLWKNT